MTSTYCTAPWIHAQIHSDGNVYPCGFTDYSYGSLKTESFDQVLNASAAQDLREHIANAKPHRACNGCYESDAKTGVSPRRYFNRCFYLNLEQRNKPARDVAPEDLLAIEVLFSNICNFKCRTCGPRGSSAWVDDANAISKTDFENHRSLKPTRSEQELWELFDRLIPSIEVYRFGGGEPLLDRDHYTLLEKLTVLKKFNVELHYSINLSVLEFEKWNVLEMWSPFPNLRISLSLDGVGAHAEFLRSGTNWLHTEKQFAKIRAHLPRKNHHVSFTLSAMNAFHLTSALSYWIKIKWIETPIDFRLTILTFPSFQSVGIYNAAERDRLRAHYAEWLELNRETISQELADFFDQEFKRVLCSLPDSTEWQASAPEFRRKFRYTMIALDKVRNEKSVELFPELVDLLYFGRDETTSLARNT